MVPVPSAEPGVWVGIRTRRGAPRRQCTSLRCPPPTQAPGHSGLPPGPELRTAAPEAVPARAGRSAEKGGQVARLPPLSTQLGGTRKMCASPPPSVTGQEGPAHPRSRSCFAASGGRCWPLRREVTSKSWLPVTKLLCVCFLFSHHSRGHGECTPLEEHEHQTQIIPMASRSPVSGLSADSHPGRGRSRGALQQAGPSSPPPRQSHAQGSSPVPRTVGRVDCTVSTGPRLVRRALLWGQVPGLPSTVPDGLTQSPEPRLLTSRAERT